MEDTCKYDITLIFNLFDSVKNICGLNIYDYARLKKSVNMQECYFSFPIAQRRETHNDRDTHSNCVHL